MNVILNGVIIARLVKWTAELLVHFPPEHMPPPFTAPEHDFAWRWLNVSNQPPLSRYVR
jgi:hypothetical protein